jgi:hypothetical protein
MNPKTRVNDVAARPATGRTRAHARKREKRARASKRKYVTVAGASSSPPRDAPRAGLRSLRGAPYCTAHTITRNRSSVMLEHATRELVPRTVFHGKGEPCFFEGSSNDAADTAGALTGSRTPVDPRVSGRMSGSRTMPALARRSRVRRSTRLCIALVSAATATGATVASTNAPIHKFAHRESHSDDPPSSDTATTPVRRERAASASDQCAFAVVSGGTMNGTTCSLASKLARYCVAACCVGNGPTRTRYHVPRPGTRASRTYAWWPRARS